MISTRPTLITRPGTRERDFLLRKHPPGSTTHSVVLSPKAATGAIVLEMKSMLRVSSPFLHSICTLSTIFFIFVQVSSDVNSECFQLENNFIICYHRAVISTRPTLITRPGTRERELCFLLRKHPPGSTTHSSVLIPQSARLQLGRLF